jgi:hypothetical protein
MGESFARRKFLSSVVCDFGISFHANFSSRNPACFFFSYLYVPLFMRCSQLNNLIPIPVCSRIPSRMEIFVYDYICVDPSDLNSKINSPFLKHILYRNVEMVEYHK